MVAGARTAAAIGWQSLTPTEQSVVGLVAEGLSNPQIGERLYISRRTVQTHLAHVFAKLDISSRAQLAAEAIRHRGQTSRGRHRPSRHLSRAQAAGRRRHHKVRAVPATAGTPAR